MAETAAALGIWRKTVRRWVAAAASADVAARLNDAPRCGAPAQFKAEQICQIMAIAYADFERLDGPIAQ